MSSHAETPESLKDKGLEKNALENQISLEKPQHIVHVDHPTPRYGVFTISLVFDKTVQIPVILGIHQIIAILKILENDSLSLFEVVPIIS